MRIAFISTIFSYPWGGADVLWTRTAGAALKQGHQVLLAVSAEVAAHPRLLALRDAGAGIHSRSGFTAYRGLRSQWTQTFGQLLRLPGSLLAALDAFRPEHVIINQGGTFDFLVEDGLCDWISRSKVPFSLVCQANHEQTALSPAERAQAARVMSRAHHVVFVSTHNRDWAIRQTGLKLANAILVHNPVEDRSPVPLPWPEIGPLRLAVVARLETQSKGLDILVEAMAACMHETDLFVDVYGRGPDEAELRSRIQSAGLSARVQLGGFQPVREIWAGHHALVLPSRGEGCSLAMLEAMSLGRPVIAADVGGVADWVEPGVNGYIFPRGDASGLADILRRAANQAPEWADMGRAAFCRIQQRHDPTPELTLLRHLHPS